MPKKKNETFIPNQDFLLIQQLAESEQTESGLYIAQQGESPVKRGLVKATGSGYIHTGVLQAPRHAEGDTVTYIEGSVVLDLTVNEIKYVVVRDRDIVGQWVNA